MSDDGVSSVTTGKEVNMECDLDDLKTLLNRFTSTLVHRRSFSHGYATIR